MPPRSPRIEWHRKTRHVSARNKPFRCETLNGSLTGRRLAPALFGAGALPLRASLNKTSYVGGDFLSLTMLTQPLSGLAAGAADFYLALVAGGAVYIFDGTNWALLYYGAQLFPVYYGAQLFPAAAKPFRANAAVMNTSEIVLQTKLIRSQTLHRVRITLRSFWCARGPIQSIE